MGEGCGHSHFSSHPMRKAQVEERTRAAIEYFLRYQQEQYKATL